jgi:hypothetical protein
MSVISLLSTERDVDLKSTWAAIDYAEHGIYFDEGSSPLAASGQIIFSGVSFNYEIARFDHVPAGPRIFCSADLGDVRSAIHLDLGPAISGGARVPAIVAVLLRLGVTLGSLLPAKAILWSPASVVSGFEYYAETVGQYIAGAAFPALICVAFDTSVPFTVQTRGLSWFCGQELVFQHAPLTTGDAMRYVVRLVHDLATRGAVEGEIDVAGMHDGETIRLMPEAGKNVLSARLIMP